MSQKKLTRTQSSLLRSSPTIRSSIQSLSSITECDDFNEISHHRREQDLEAGEKEEKQRRRKPVKSFGSINRIKPGLAFTLACLSFLSLSSFLLFFIDEIFTSENLLLGLIFVALALFFASRNMAVINQTVIAIKQIRVRSRIKHKHKPVQWYIGDTKPEPIKEEAQRLVVKEGVQYFSNGDSTKVNSTEGSVTEVECTIISLMEDMKEIGSMEDTMVMESSVGLKEVNIKDSISKDLDMVMEFTGFTPEILTPVNGLTVKAMALVFKLVLMVALLSENSNLVSNMDLVLTISGKNKQKLARTYKDLFVLFLSSDLWIWCCRNGDKYAGEYFGDKIHGFGVYHFANGHYYEGAWHEGRKQGYGTYRFRTGDIKSGEWDDGSLVNHLSPDSDPVRRAVQSARERAKNGVNQRRVDEHVIRAVAAANKAATAARVAAVKAVQNQMDGKICDN
ncbi:hypothetical protein ARALYDRAFT_339925 [Arabidopsis lyrata subsp. lyrata]|uniref:MORN repeat-containing protein n=1 Tax=Arabidopsis lyrata subsp. lyrata TaxID=81972 RepID=D7KUL3_ARALL|nr:hypothetical protein ARALYDRAFT_339925 [Arabidopsis lyrata subsp. lyrata]